VSVTRLSGGERKIRPKIGCKIAVMVPIETIDAMKPAPIKTAFRG
jgi:hypothetical protein